MEGAQDEDDDDDDDDSDNDDVDYDYDVDDDDGDDDYDDDNDDVDDDYDVDDDDGDDDDDDVIVMMLMMIMMLIAMMMMMMMMVMMMMKLMMIMMLFMIIIHNPTAAWGGEKTHWQADRSCSCLRSYWALNKSNGLFGFCLTCDSLLQKFKSIRFFRAATCLACLDHFFFGKQSIHWARLLYIFKWWSLFCWCTNFLYSKECDLNRNTISHIENMLRDMASTLNSRGAPELRKLACDSLFFKLYGLSCISNSGWLSLGLRCSLNMKAEKKLTMRT